MVNIEQIDEWRIQLQDEPASFARDLAHVLLLELERLHAAELACERRFASAQAGLIRDQLAEGAECVACSDIALRRVEERMRFFRSPPTRATPAVARSPIARPRHS